MAKSRDRQRRDDEFVDTHFEGKDARKARKKSRNTTRVKLGGGISEKRNRGQSRKNADYDKINARIDSMKTGVKNAKSDATTEKERKNKKSK